MLVLWPLQAKSTKVEKQYNVFTPSIWYFDFIGNQCQQITSRLHPSHRLIVVKYRSIEIIMVKDTIYILLMMKNEIAILIERIVLQQNRNLPLYYNWAVLFHSTMRKQNQFSYSYVEVINFVYIHKAPPSFLILWNHFSNAWIRLPLYNSEVPTKIHAFWVR